MLKQYHEIKSVYPDVVLFYRMGDFYELFYDDAKLASEVLGLTLTRRNHGKEGDVALAGFPYHQLETYLAKMTRAGYRVAICDQIEDPKLAKGIVKRAVTEVVSSGTTFSDSVLVESRNNYLAAIYLDETSAGLAYTDVTAQEFFTGMLPLPELGPRLAALEPSEILCIAEQKEYIKPLLLGLKNTTVTVIPAWQFTVEAATRTLTGHFGVNNLKGFGLAGLDLAVATAGALVHYLKSNLVDAKLLPDLQIFTHTSELILDATARRNLELVESISGHPQGTLVSVLDCTRTPSGARLLRKWILSPLTDLSQILERQSRVGYLFDNPAVASKLSDLLGGIGDLQRLLSRLTTRRGSPRDAVAIRCILERFPTIRNLFTQETDFPLAPLLAKLDPHKDLVEFLKSVLADDPPAMLGEGYTVRTGYSAELDDLRNVGRNARTWIQEHQIQERDRSGIPSLKIGYNKVFGYYIEITNAHKEKIPQNYIRKQTLTNAERYVTPELKTWEEKILSADEKIAVLEAEIWERVRGEIASRGESLTRAARALAELDAILSLAKVARDRKYNRPIFVSDGSIEIIGGRHPVVESLLPAGQGFVPNDLRIGTPDHQIMVLTGPNMAGKSTYLRQAAIISIMAQMGGFVPAELAKLSIIDRIFTRVGAGDNLAGGESTFLVEMTEVANILRNATVHSLVILDEVGRGTSTYDGLSLAWAITEYLHENPKIAAKTLFATHYHELNRMAELYPRIQNARIEVEEWGDRIVFLHKIGPGETDKSYGIEVARLAGLPSDVVTRAKSLLPTWEGQNSGKIAVQLPPDPPAKIQLTLFESGTQRVAAALLALDLDSLSPREALDKLFEIKSLLSSPPPVKTRKIS